MELQLLRDKVRSMMKESRYRHMLGTEAVAYDLALIYGYDTEKASIAGILHDCAKCLSDRELLKECDRYELPVTEVEKQKASLLHAKVGAAYAKDKFGITDEDIINSIWYHTTGRPGMSLLEKIIYTADYIEPCRELLPDIDRIRRAAYNDLDRAVTMITKNILDYLTNTGERIDTRTLETYKYYKAVLQKK